jgi:hypothetical protein
LGCLWNARHHNAAFLACAGLSCMDGMAWHGVPVWSGLFAFHEDLGRRCRSRSTPACYTVLAGAISIPGILLEQEYKLYLGCI